MYEKKNVKGFILYRIYYGDTLKYQKAMRRTAELMKVIVIDTLSEV